MYAIGRKMNRTVTTPYSRDFSVLHYFNATPSSNRKPPALHYSSATLFFMPPLKLYLKTILISRVKELAASRSKNY
jgi:hypothetical protein